MILHDNGVKIKPTTWQDDNDNKNDHRHQNDKTQNDNQDKADHLAR